MHWFQHGFNHLTTSAPSNKFARNGGVFYGNSLTKCVNLNRVKWQAVFFCRSSPPPPKKKKKNVSKNMKVWESINRPKTPPFFYFLVEKKVGGGHLQLLTPSSLGPPCPSSGMVSTLNGSTNLQVKQMENMGKHRFISIDVHHISRDVLMSYFASLFSLKFFVCGS